MGLTLTEKILKAHLVDGEFVKGSEIGIRIDQTLTQDATGTMAYLEYEAMGVPRVKTEKSVAYIDHNTLQSGFENADDHRFIGSVAKKHGIYFSRPGNGICHQVHLERFGIPGKTLIGSDSHTPTGGGIGMIAIGAGGLDVAVAMGGGAYYITYPQIVKVNLIGKLNDWVSAKDVILEVLRRISVKGGVEYPIGALSATFKWINESTVSPRQKLDPLAKITFSYHTAEIRIAQTFLSQILTMEAFENKIAEVIAVAYLQAMDYGIVNGSGNGTMLGILNDTRVTTQSDNIITMTAADMSDWQKWRKKFFAKLPLGYRKGEFIFPLSTVDAYLETMADANGNPIFRQATGLTVNDGDAVNPNGTFFGRGISLVEPDILPDFDTANSNDIVGIFWQPEEYAINENFGFTMRRYFDEETNEWVDKAIVVVDGKVLNPKGFYLIKKG